MERPVAAALSPAPLRLIRPLVIEGLSERVPAGNCGGKGYLLVGSFPPHFGPLGEELGSGAGKGTT